MTNVDRNQKREDLSLKNIWTPVRPNEEHYQRYLKNEQRCKIQRNASDTRERSKFVRKNSQNVESYFIR